MKRNIAVIGGGASGMMAAITAAKHGAAVTIYEPKERLGKKLLATGNGKCNFTNLHQTMECYRGTKPEFAKGILEAFTVEQTLAFFESIGIVPKVKNGYVYPNSEQAASVADALFMEVKERNIVVKKEEVTALKKNKNGYTVNTEQGNQTYDKIILCVGSRAGMSEKTEFLGYRLAEGLGISLVPVRPALVQLRCAEKWFKTVSGVRTEAVVTLFADGKKIAREQGEILFADYGLSGIPVFQISRFAGEALDDNKKVTCTLDFFPQHTFEEMKELLKQRAENSGIKTAEELLVGLLNHKLNYIFLKESGMNPTASAEREFADVKKRAALAGAYKSLTCTVTATNPFANAQVCAGGVATDELNDKTLEVKKLQGCYVAGELADIDGTCGGYNLQWAWSSGYVAGLHAAADA